MRRINRLLVVALVACAVILASVEARAMLINQSSAFTTLIGTVICSSSNLARGLLVLSNGQWCGAQKIDGISVGGVFDVTEYGADPTGVTAADSIVNSVVTVACPSGHCTTPIYFPAPPTRGTGALYRFASEANFANLDGLHILCGGSGLLKDTASTTGASVTLQDTMSGSNGFDFAGTSNRSIENCRFLSSTTVHAQTMLMLLGKITSGVNPTANPNRFRDCTFISSQPYNVYNYGDESTDWDNCKFVNYYNYPALTVSSCTEPSSNTAQCVTTAAHGLTGGERVRFAGVSVPGYNGTYVVTKIDNTTLQYTIRSSGLGTGSGGTAQPIQPGIVISSANGAGVASAHATLRTHPVSMKANTFEHCQFNSFTTVGGIGPAILFDNDTSGGIGTIRINDSEAELYNNGLTDGTISDDSNAETGSYMDGLFIDGLHDESATGAGGGGPTLLLNGIYLGADLKGASYATGTPGFIPLQGNVIAQAVVHWTEFFGSNPTSLMTFTNCVGSEINIAATAGTVGACPNSHFIIDPSHP